MLTVPRLVELMSEVLEVPSRRIIHVARRLGEADLLPRTGRGASAPPIDSADAVRLLLAVMSLGDGIDGTASRIVLAVEGIDRLHGEALRLGDPGDPAAGLRLAPAGGFAAALVAVVEATRRYETAVARRGGERQPGVPDNLAELVRDFGLCFQGEARSAWIRAGPPGSRGPEVIRTYRAPGSGDWGGVGALSPFPGLTRLALLPGSFLATLARALQPGDARSKAAQIQADSAETGGGGPLPEAT